MLHLRFSEFFTAAFLRELRLQALRVRFLLEFVFLLILEFMKASGPSRVRGEMAMAGLRLLLLLHGMLYIRCCPFPLCTVTVNFLTPRTAAGCLLRAGGEACSEASCAEAGKTPGTADATAVRPNPVALQRLLV